VALLENHQQKDGSVYIPHSLRPYLRNRNRINLWKYCWLSLLFL